MLWHRYSCMPDYDFPADAYYVSACGNRMSSHRDPVSGSDNTMSACADAVPNNCDQHDTLSGSRDKVSARTD
jgi:hypothetical protein